MDFVQIRTRETKQGGLELYPSFVVGNSKDLMVQGGSFYAIWDEEAGFWSQDEFAVVRLVDEELRKEADRLGASSRITVKWVHDMDTGIWTKFVQTFLRSMPDTARALNTKLVFANQQVKKSDYVSKQLPYPLREGDTSAWDELLGTLYAVPERDKIEWAIGSIVAGDSKTIQKFFVFYGSGGTGKSTILKIIESLFSGYTTVFDAGALGSKDSSFATEMFKNSPLVAIQHDGDLSRLDDNTRLNSIISHETMVMNEKYKASYSARIDAMLFMGSNQPVKITDAKSGIIRRLIDITPTGVTFPERHYDALISQIEFELGAIAFHCHQKYLRMGKNYYKGYRAMEMILQTDVFFNFIEAYYDVFKAQDAVTASQAYTMYKEFCAESGIERPMPRHRMRDELRNYFDDFTDRGRLDGEAVRSLYTGFNAEKFKAPKEETGTFSLVMEETESIFDEVMAQQPAQLGTAEGTPSKKWENVKTTLADIDTSQLHFVQVPPNHIVIDFDLKESNGHTGLERNLEAASLWPSTYGEVSRSGSGIHLHYTYTGDPSELSPAYSDGIEVKVYRGEGSLRRMRSRCNAVPISEISSGLPKREKKEKMLGSKTITTERGLRDLIHRNLRKEIHPGTKPSVDFIKKILDDAHESDMVYDVTDLRPRIVAFANNSSNQAKVALKVVQEMQFTSGDEEIAGEVVDLSDDRIAFFDVEVYPNLFVICWKFQGSDEVVKMINPKPHEVEALFKLKLVGFYNRRYDNHILYAASMGASTEDLFKLSAKMVVDNNRSASFGAAYSLSYADIWDFSSEKMGLKKFEIKLGILHMELELPWDQPVADEDIERVVEYCANDVRATEAVFESRRGDWVARQILAELSGLTVNDSTQNHTAKIIFGGDKNPSKKFVYTDLSGEFPGYKFELGKSSYKGEDPGEGGYVYAEPGFYENVAELDVASMHPASIEALNLFGPYTQNFSDLKSARIAIKRGDFVAAKEMLDGRLAPYLQDEGDAETLSYALKIVINTVYGLTSAKFDNAFRDLRNVDNIVAKRGALFMIDLKLALQEMGYTVAHIKTDSVKIPDAGPEVAAIIMDMGKKYGYEFEDEGVYERFCLVNDAVYVARKDGVWTAVGAQFAHPYVFKTLFSGEEVTFHDLCEAKSVTKGTMYLDYNGADSVEHMRHVGKTGQFVPVLEGGATLYRVYEDKFFAVSGTKGHKWMEAHVHEAMDNEAPEIDMSYFDALAEKSRATIEAFVPFERFVS